MEEKHFARVLRRAIQALKAAFTGITILLLLMILLVGQEFSQTSANPALAVHTTRPPVVDGIHPESGLIDGPGLQLVVQNCTSCHSAKLISQNRMSMDGWRNTIRWMQETQNLWDLGADEETILQYLASNYAPMKSGRRKSLGKIDWYKMEE